MVVITLLKAVGVRIAFLIHCFIAIWRVVVTYNNKNYWWLLGLLLGLTIETFVTLRKRMGKEWRWFSPSIFFYLVAAIPPIWLLEIHLLNLRHQEAEQITIGNRTGTPDSIFGLEVPMIFDEYGWALAIEQSLFSILIIGRWFLPRGDVSRDQLSQILLVHVGMAADIMELFEVFEEPKIITVPYLIYPLLSLWTLSILQYCLVITTTKARKSRFGGLEDIAGSGDENNEEPPKCCAKHWNADVIGIMTTIFMQDLPFFIFRVYLLSVPSFVSHMMVFFTCKNTLVILLQVYRLLIIFMASHDDDAGEAEDPPESGNVIPLPELVHRDSVASSFGRNKVLPMIRKNSASSNESIGSESNVRNSTTPHMPERSIRTPVSLAWSDNAGAENNDLNANPHPKMN